MAAPVPPPTGKKASPVSITDVALGAGVSIGTVSRVMNGESRVGTELSRKVFLEARRVGFVPRTQHTHLAIITGRRHPTMPMGYTDIVTSLTEQMASRKGFTVEVVDEEHIDRIYDCRIGVAIGVVFSNRIQELQSVPNLPVITINHPMVGQGIHSIYVDHYEQGLLAAKHLVEKGHRRIALLEDLPDEWGAMERRRGAVDALKDAGVSMDSAWIRFSGSGPVYDILQRWIRNGVTAILNLSEDVVPEVLHILSNVLGLRIGKDISTITLEDIPIYQYFSPPQTVIRQPLEAMAMLAVDKAFELASTRNDGISETLDIRMHGDLVERDSVAEITDHPLK